MVDTLTSLKIGVYTTDKHTRCAVGSAVCWSILTSVITSFQCQLALMGWVTTYVLVYFRREIVVVLGNPQLRGLLQQGDSCMNVIIGIIVLPFLLIIGITSRVGLIALGLLMICWHILISPYHLLRWYLRERAERADPDLRLMKEIAKGKSRSSDDDIPF